MIEKMTSKHARTIGEPSSKLIGLSAATLVTELTGIGATSMTKAHSNRAPPALKNGAS